MVVRLQPSFLCTYKTLCLCFTTLFLGYKISLSSINRQVNRLDENTKVQKKTRLQLFR